ncbi:MAG: polyprenyl synthetase family protein [Spirochaetales bacterium]|nr:polyprenyl synthetase family protein [Spirochaetales bacterium]
MTSWDRKRELIDGALRDAMERFDARYHFDRALTGFGADLREFVVRPGRRLRPTLFLTILEGYGVDPNEEVLAVAAAIELLHDCALIHDDIVDDAEFRREGAAFHLSHNPAASASNVGKGVLAGDLLYTFAVRLLLGDTPDATRRRLLEHILDVAAITSLAQLEEMHFIPRDPPADIFPHLLDLYDRKSGIYTFAAPMELARLFADGPAGDRPLLHSIGVQLGRAYQLQDDLSDIRSALEGDRDGAAAPPWEFNLAYAMLAAEGEIDTTARERDAVVSSIRTLLRRPPTLAALERRVAPLVSSYIDEASSLMAAVSNAHRIHATLQSFFTQIFDVLNGAAREL